MSQLRVVYKNTQFAVRRYFRFQTRGFQKVSENILLESLKLNENILSYSEGTRKCPSSAEMYRHLLNPLPCSEVTVRLGTRISFRCCRSFQVPLLLLKSIFVTKIINQN